MYIRLLVSPWPAIDKRKRYRGTRARGGPPCFCSAKHATWGQCYFPNGMLVHRRVTASQEHAPALFRLSNGPQYPFIRLGEEKQCGAKFPAKETTRRQRPGSNNRPSNRKSNALTTSPSRASTNRQNKFLWKRPLPVFDCMIGGGHHSTPQAVSFSFVWTYIAKQKAISKLSMERPRGLARWKVRSLHDTWAAPFNTFSFSSQPSHMRWTRISICGQSLGDRSWNMRDYTSEVRLSDCRT